MRVLVDGPEFRNRALLTQERSTPSTRGRTSIHQHVQ